MNMKSGSAVSGGINIERLGSAIKSVIVHAIILILVGIM